MRGACRSFLIVSLALSPVTAWAQEPSTQAQTQTQAQAPPLDTVFLRNGGLYRGRVIEIVPDDHVTLAVEKGQAKKILWIEIDRVELAPTSGADTGSSSGSSSGTTKIPTVETAPPDTLEVGPRVIVHIASPKPTLLYRRPVGTTSWSLVCRSPCDKDLPDGGSYRIEGNGMSRTKEFSFRTTPNTTHMELRVDPGTAGGVALGGVMLAGGIVTSYVGLAVGLGKNASSETQRNGLIAFAIGAVVTITGIFIYRSNSTSGVTQQSTEGLPPPKDPWPPADKTTSKRSEERNDRATMPVPPLDAFVREAGFGFGHTSSPAPVPTFPVLLQHEF